MTTLLEHPRIYLDASGEVTDALLVDGGRVRAVGSEARDRGAGAERVRPDGACLFPALTDAHCHPWGLHQRPDVVDLSEADSPRAIYEALAAGRPGAHGWLLGHGWDDHRWEGGATLHRDELDRRFGEVPVLLHRVDHHAAWVNTAALRRAGLDPQSYNPTSEGAAQSGHAERDASGRLTGRLVDEAVDPVREALPEATLDEHRRVLRDSARMYREMGVTSAHAAWVPVEHLGMLREMHAAGEMPMRLAVMLDADDPDLEEVLAGGPFGDEWLSCRAVKFFADGALGSRGAALLDGYPDGSRGLCPHGADELARRIPGLLGRGWQVAVHAIGDRGARHALDAFAEARASARRRCRPRLEHAQMLHPDDLRRLRTLETIASIQPVHMVSDATWADRVLSDEQLERLFRWRDMDRLTDLAAGSDYPIEDPSPWRGIAAALDRRDADGAPFAPEQALGREAILAAYTSGAARAAHLEDDLGALRPGYVADIIALDVDPFLDAPDTIREARVLASYGPQTGGATPR